MKTCTKCGTTKPLSEFGKASRTRDGLYPSCKACRSIVVASWQKSNPQKANAKAAKWRAANPGRGAAWAATNPEACRIHRQNRRARNVGKLTKGLADKLFKLQRGKCACGCKQPLGNGYHLDHIMPLKLGGTNTDDNMQLLTATCNMHKHAKHPIDFMQSKGFLL